MLWILGIVFGAIALLISPIFAIAGTIATEGDGMEASKSYVMVNIAIAIFYTSPALIVYSLYRVIQAIF